MAVAIEGTPTHILDGGSYTAETSGSDRLVVFVVHVDAGSSGASVTGVDMGAQAATEEVESNPAAVSGTCSVWYIKDADIPTGSQTLSITLSTGTIQGSGIMCYTFSGVDQTTPSAGNASTVSTGNSDTVSFSGLTTSSSGYGVGGAHFQEFTNRTWTPPSGWTEDFDVGSSALSKCGVSRSTDGTTLSGDFVMDTSRNGERNCALMAIAPTAGAPASTFRGLTLLGVGS